MARGKVKEQPQQAAATGGRYVKSSSNRQQQQEWGQKAICNAAVCVSHTLDMRPVPATPSCFISSSILPSRGFRSSSTAVSGAAQAAALQMREASLVTEAKVEVATKRASCLMACSWRSLGNRAKRSSIMGLHSCSHSFG